MPDALICDVDDVLRLADATAVDLTVPRWQPRYRILPGDDVLVVIQDRTRRLGRMPWGWQRGDATSRGHALTLVRADEAPGRCVRPFVNGRCVVLITGFFARMAKVMPSALPGILVARCGPAAIAALWKTEAKEANARAGVVLLTTRAHEDLAMSVPRMPALLPFEAIDEWLDSNTTHLRLRKLMQPYWVKSADVYEGQYNALDRKAIGDNPDVLEPRPDALT